MAPILARPGMERPKNQERKKVGPKPRKTPDTFTDTVEVIHDKAQLERNKRISQEMIPPLETVERSEASQEKTEPAKEKQKQPPEKKEQGVNQAKTVVKQAQKLLRAITEIQKQFKQFEKATGAIRKRDAADIPPERGTAREMYEMTKRTAKVCGLLIGFGALGLFTPVGAFVLPAGFAYIMYRIGIKPTVDELKRGENCEKIDQVEESLEKTIQNFQELGTLPAELESLQQEISQIAETIKSSDTRTNPPSMDKKKGWTIFHSMARGIGMIETPKHELSDLAKKRKGSKIILPPKPYDKRNIFMRGYDTVLTGGKNLFLGTIKLFTGTDFRSIDSDLTIREEYSGLEMFANRAEFDSQIDTLHKKLEELSSQCHELIDNKSLEVKDIVMGS